MGFGIEEVSFIKVLTDLRKGEHTASIDMQVLTDLLQYFSMCICVKLFKHGNR